MFCSAVIGALQAGQAERGTTRLKGSACAAAASAAPASAPRELGALLAPLPLEHDRQPVDDDIQEAADEQPQHQARADEQARRGGQQLDHGHDCPLS